MRRINRTVQARREPRKIVGSIGIAWPPLVDRSPVRDGVTGRIHSLGNDRMKGFIPFILTRGNAKGVLKEVREEGEREGVSRITIRALVRIDGPFDWELIRTRDAGLSTLNYEGSICVGENLHLVYFGYNTTDRTAPIEVCAEQVRAMETILTREPSTSEQLMEVMNRNGYVFDKEIDTTNGDMERLITLYRLSMPRYLMELNRENLIEMIKNPENGILVVRHEGTIIASALAEHATVQVGEYTLPLVEISECVTDPEYRGQGLMSAIIHGLIREYQSGAILYSEARASHLPMNIALRKNGFYSEHTDLLPKQCIIGDIEPAEGNGPYRHMENLRVWSRVIR